MRAEPNTVTLRCAAERREDFRGIAQLLQRGGDDLHVEAVGLVVDEPQRGLDDVLDEVGAFVAAAVLLDELLDERLVLIGLGHNTSLFDVGRGALLESSFEPSVSRGPTTALRPARVYFSCSEVYSSDGGV